VRIVAVIQARMGSSRLPGKVLLPLADKPVLQHVVERVVASGAFDDVVVATTTRAIDDVIVQFAPTIGATVVRGDEDDVLSRFGIAARVSRADAIMRITADCPLIDADILAEMTDRFRRGDVDVVTNCLVRTLPRGLDAELFSRDVLDTMLEEAKSASHREHVTPFIYENSHRFRVHSYELNDDHSRYRLTLDTPEDFELLQHLFGGTVDPASMRLSEIIAQLRNRPDWVLLNAHVEQKTA
jgi:spore coat polysaccharide biosynthesis protein SpsF